MAETSTCLDFTVTRLNTLHFFIEQSLVALKAQVEDAPSLDGDSRLQVAGRLQNLTNLVAMATEISECLEPALRDVARTVQGLGNAGEIHRACVNTIFENYTEHLGELAAEQLIADALRT